MEKLMEVVLDGDDVFVITGELNHDDLFDCYDNIFVEENDKPIFSFGKMNCVELFNSFLADYLSDKKEEGVEFVYVHDDIVNYKNKIQEYVHEYQGEKVPNLFVTRYGGKLELVAVSSKGYRYYENNDEILFVVTDENGEMVTDNPAYYLQDLENEKNFLYLADWVKARLEESED